MSSPDQSGIVQVTPYFRAVRGGVTTMVSTLVHQLAQQTQISVVITGEQNGELSHAMDGVAVTDQRLRLPYGGDGLIKAVLGWMIYLLPTLVALCAVSRQIKAGIMHLHVASAEGLYFRLLHLWNRCPYIVTVHGSDVMRYHEGRWLARWLIRFTLKGACRVVAVSDALARSAVERFPFVADKITVIHNGVDSNAIRNAIAHRGSSEYVTRRPYFICVGGLLAVKGHDIAIRAWALLKDRAPELDLMIVGVGDLHDEYLKLIASLGLQQSVNLVGGFPAERVWQIMTGAVGMIVPSHSEGLPYTVLEAGVIGLPVVATRVGGIPELIRDGQDGLLVPAESPQELADAVVRLYSDREFAATLARSLSDRVVKSYSAEAMAEQYRSIYRQCGWRAPQQTQ